MRASDPDPDVVPGALVERRAEIAAIERLVSDARRL
jgi:hypothetical protein